MRTEIPQMGKYRRSPRPGESNLKRLITERPPTTEKCSMPTGVTHPDPGKKEKKKVLAPPRATGKPIQIHTTTEVE